ncbi:MAG: conserved hypothetical signal peptide protein [Phenylobacterium sp.]|jgi:hypothetical protein|uniref:hypothetical protein n=1 Tax=Phenylobacterium sp. TaxID=1871053 RepID=UPI002613185C|nr:hypothetical protein [Phenylobacterium sp.]MDB5462863.1 conserved hypothetical signal peptide protein [Phenylobacterium sp.]MDB5496872.1 conserved hypothetical signal peptide protein [Phenylobacterium sp.]
MPRLPLAFFSAATLCALGGMTWGVIMAASNDHGMMTAHAHLNLMGWATLALMGGFYALTGKGGRLGWINFALSASGVVVAIPSLALLLTGNKAAEAGATAGSLLALLGMLVFLVVVLSGWRDAKTA